ncbi:MAG TPA: hypothetical protein VFO55_02005 [Gemmatimonadaceae bacterium]|nr:hypothetical protein [Gemmatimonadaceae bacterium]
MTRIAMSVGLLALLIWPTPLSGQRSARRVIDAAGIAAAGWHHLADIASALPPGGTATVDGFNHAMTSSRTGFVEASGSSARWSVRLDGQSMPVSLEGLWILDAIPVAITQIDSVVITDGPRVVDGRAALLGTIDLYTRRPRRGLSAVADYQHGDESGDPGPYRYTARTAPNVEKLGPFASGAAAFGAGPVSIDAAARYSSLNITDARIVNRLPGVFGSLQSDVNASGGSGVLTGRLGGGEHRIIAGRGRFTGLMYLPATGEDQSARVVVSHAGISGSASTSAFAARYAITATLLEVDSLGAALPFTIGQDRLIGDAFIEAGGVSSRFRFGAGMNAGRQEVPGVTSQRRAERAWAAFAGRRETATLSLERSLGDLRVAMSARREAAIADSQTLGLSVTALNTWRDSDNAWMDGFRSSASHAGSIAVGDVRADLTTKQLLGMVPTWYVRAFAFSGVSDAGEDYGIAAGIVASTIVPRRVNASLRGEVSQTMGATGPDDASTPGGFVEASASTVTSGRFHLALSARYAPGTVWPQLEPGADIRLPETRRIDLSVNKPMWRNRVRAQLVIRNLLNAAEVTHPLGAQWNLRTHLAVTIALPPVPGGSPW